MTNSTERSRRILIIRNAYAHDFGGGERMPVELASELSKHQYRPLIVSRSKRLLDLAESRGLQTKKGWWWSFQDWSSWRVLLFPIYLLWQLVLTMYYLTLIAWYRVGIVHPQSRDDFIAATIAGKILRKKVVWTDHADLKYVFRNHPVWFKNPVGKLVFLLSKYAIAVIIVSHNEQKEIEHCLGHGVPANYKVIYNGVSGDPVAACSRDSADTKAVIFAATSRLVKSKGMFELVAAFNTLSNHTTQYRLWLFGDGPDEQNVKALAKNNPNIIFKGFRDDVQRQLAATDIFIHPSYHEGFSVSLVEAAKLGLPIIACNAGGNPEIVSNNGILVAPRDEGALLTAMKTLAEDASLRKQMGKASEKIFVSSFMWENIVNRDYRKIYETS